MSLPRHAGGALQRRLRGLGLQTAQCQSGDDQLVDRAGRRQQGRGIEIGQSALGLVELTDEHHAADFEAARIGGIDAVAVLRQGVARLRERLGRP